MAATNTAGLCVKEDLSDAQMQPISGCFDGYPLARPFCWVTLTFLILVASVTVAPIDS